MKNSNATQRFVVCCFFIEMIIIGAVVWLCTNIY